MLGILACLLASIIPAKAQEASVLVKFDDLENFEGWNCEKITTCGELGQVCGGFNVKAKESEITKKFTLPPGTYTVEMDFIRIDSWFVCVI